jgi:hypothetical protein
MTMRVENSYHYDTVAVLWSPEVTHFLARYRFWYGGGLRGVPGVLSTEHMATPEGESTQCLYQAW